MNKIMFFEGNTGIVTVLLWVPALLILLMNILHPLSKKENTFGMILFYAAMFASAAFGISAGDTPDSALFGLFVCLPLGAFPAIFFEKGNEHAMFFGAVSGLIVSPAAGAFTGKALQYFAFLFIVCLTSFAISEIIQIEIAAKERSATKCGA